MANPTRPKAPTEQERAERFIRQHLKPLKGCTIIELAVNENADYGWNRPDVGLIVRKESSNEQFVVWASADQEGNGPGWLELQKL